MGWCAMAQDIQWPQSYNIERAHEALNDDNHEEALRYVNMELENNKKSGYAYMLKSIALAMQDEEQLGAIFEATEKALKFLPKKDKMAVYQCYRMESGLYTSVEDTASAIAVLTKAISLLPQVTAAYEDRGDLYYEMSKYALSDADYKAMLRIEPQNYYATMALGRNAEAQGQHEVAIGYYEKVMKYYPNVSSPYSFRAVSYFALKKYAEAVDDVVTALDIDGDNKAFYLLFDLADSAFVAISSRLRLEMRKAPQNSNWPYCLGIVNEQKEYYQEAIEAYNQSNKLEVSGMTYNRLSWTYESMGDFVHAIENINKALEMDSTNYRYREARARFYVEMDNYKGAQADMDYLTEQHPDYVTPYLSRARYYLIQGKYEEALDEASIALIINKESLGAMTYCAVAYHELGREDDMKAMCEKVIVGDPKDENKCAAYAYAYMGDTAGLQPILEKRIHEADSTKEAGDYYQLGNLYAILGKHEKAMEYVQLALENDYYYFNSMLVDWDFRDLRHTDEFKNMVEAYRAKHEAALAAGEVGADANDYEEVTSEIPFTKEGGVTKVKCTINGLPLHFVFDTGASDVTMSAIEAAFMFKNDYLSSKDVMGKKYYMTADGNVSEGTVINLKTVHFGDLELTDIRASVSRSQAAPLLLGQSVLQKLGKIEIDNERQVIKITYKKHKE